MNRRINQMAAIGALALCFGNVHAQGKTFLTMDSFPAGSTPGQFGIAFTQVVQKHLPIEIQVSVGKPATKSAVDAAKGKVDLFLSAPTVNHFMQTKTAMFAKVNDAPELNKNLRNIISYPLGPYQIVVYEDSGIRTLQDFKGKKVFLGPPAGAATKVAMQIMEGATTLKPEQDYEVMRFDWASAETAFLDRQMDVYIAPTTLPSPSIQQFALVSKIRILGVPAEAWEQPAMKAAMGLPGRTVEVIPKDAYTNQANDEEVKTIGSWVGLGVRKDLDEKIVYQMTKTLWENIADLRQTADWMKVITKETAFKESNIPLHAGAYRYYKEAGFDVPAAQIPPEAK
ncbi:MAG: TAXI family TRAP transporter solute-binding subunit [Gammaproteobacteria bacterium]|nr:TAXI family TRAP transporter solute-binding subunit [Gammaproteobacteria bacterium]